MPIKKSPTEATDEIFALLQRRGQEDYFGEPVSQIEHAFQCAELAEEEGYGEEVILAALLHDIGHICALPGEEEMPGLGILRHEQVGAYYLRKCGFSEKICRLVEGHVQAKRYLTFKNSHYYENLSEASRQTLKIQGGRMDAEEAEAFENNFLFEMMVKMRLWNEAGKAVGKPLPDMERYRGMCLRHLQSEEERGHHKIAA
ncbi:MAG: HDIG domain-containing protein [Saprospiraceae bacterium]|nr:HDIG domain-containing protein [Saprospiraceae bacterium]